MKERPILFAEPMVCAILAGTKTQTRRPAYVVTKQVSRARFDRRFPPSYGNGEWPNVPPGHAWTLSRWYDVQVGDRLWVRERLSYDSERGHFYAATEPGTLGNPSGRTYVDYDNETPANGLPARSIPSIHMPRWASRISLEVTRLRVQRLQNISEADAVAEGVHTDPACPAYEAYRTLWGQINGPDSWDANPWVFAVDFERLP